MKSPGERIATGAKVADGGELRGKGSCESRTRRSEVALAAQLTQRTHCVSR